MTRPSAFDVISATLTQWGGKLSPAEAAKLHRMTGEIYAARTDVAHRRRMPAGGAAWMRSGRTKAALDYIASAGSPVGAVELSFRLGCSTDTARCVMKRLLTRGVVERVGPGQWRILAR